MRVLGSHTLAFFRLAVALMLPLAPNVSSAQAIYQSVHDFVQGPGHPIGRLLEASDGKVYGVTSTGGSHRGGTIFRAGRDLAGNWSTSTLHDFAPSDGMNPAAGLAEGSDGLLYGTTSYGGGHNAGTIFRISKTGFFQRLHSFNAAIHGTRPLLEPLALADDGAFYGTASAGGVHGLGTVFRITPGGSFSVVRAFSGFDGAVPAGGVIRGADGALYGTTRHGGHLWGAQDQIGVGTVFRITTTGAHTILHSFGDANAPLPFWTHLVNVGLPLGGLVQGSDGLFYGVTASIGSTVYRVSAVGTHAIVMRMGCPDPYILSCVPPPPAAAPTLARGRNSAVYMVDSSLRLHQVHPSLAVEYTPTAEEKAEAGGTPAGGVVQVADGTWVGTTSQLALGGQGALFTIGGAATGMTTVTAFTSSGYSPTGTLKLGPEGMLYGTTSQGGPNHCDHRGSYGGCGTVFRLSSGAAPAVEHFAFSTIQAHLFGDVEITSDGAIWAAPDRAPTKAMTLAGAEIAMPSSFKSPHAPLEASDGNLYGFVAGTSLTPSTLIRRATDGTVTTLATLSHQTPFAALMETSGGTLCGTEPYGGFYLKGQLFCHGVGATPSFDGFGGSVPLGRLVESGDGFLYGTTYAGGPQFDGDTDGDGIPSGYGVVFKIASDMSGFEVIHTFSPAGGIHPYAGLTVGPGDLLYGTTSAGGQHGVGTAFSISPDGVYTVLHSFTPAQGHVPIGGLVVGPDGALYGTTLLGGSGNAGTVYRLVLPAAQGNRQRD